MKELDNLISKIVINEANFEYIAKNKKINGSLYTSIHNALREAYHLGNSTPNWINVKDKLPNIKNVIVSYKFGVGEAVYYNGKFVLPNNWDTEIPEVTHWMPLPTLPEK